MTSFSLWPVIPLGIAGSAVFNLAPVYLTDASHRLMLNDQEIGQLMGVEIAGIAIASVLAMVLIRFLRITTIAMTGLLVLVAGNLLTLVMTDFMTFMTARLFVGLFGAGMAYVSAILFISQHQRKVFGFALFSFSNMVATAMLLWLLPMISSHSDHQGAQLVISALGILALLCLPRLPWNLVLPSKQAINPGNIPSLSILGLLGLAVYTMNLGAVWTFSESILDEVIHDENLSARILSLSIIFQALGSLAAMRLGRVFQAARMLKSVVIIQMFSMFALASADSLLWLVVGLGLWGASWNFGLPFILGSLAKFPSSSNHMALVPGIEALGVATGPLIASMFIDDNVRSVVPTVGFATALIATGFLLMSFRFLAAKGE